MNSITDVRSESQGVMDPEFESTNDILIASDASNSSQPFNKYHHPEFAGFGGERYLDATLQAILPFALFRTWHNLTIREAPEQGAYAGVIRLAGVAARSERKIYLDLERLRHDGLVSFYKAYRNVLHADGSYRPALVTIKDFTGLYDLAHAYHLWTLDPRYVAPLREHAEYIRDDAELFAICIKFECYRKILLHAKPGPKQASPKGWSSQSLETLLARAKEVAEKDAKGAHAHESAEKDGNLNKQLSTQLFKDSAYGPSSTDNDLPTYRGSEFSIAEKGRVLAPTTIRSGTDETPLGSKTKRNETRNESAAAQTAKDDLGYNEDELKYDVQKRGAALVGVSADQYRKLHGGPDQCELDAQREREREAQQERERDATAQEQANRQERERPAHIKATIEDYVRQYDEPPLIASDVTRAYKIYFAAEEILEHFNDGLFWNTFSEAKEAAAKYASKYVNRQNRVNRVPYMFSCLENGFGFSLEELVYLRTEDPLFLEYSVWDVLDRIRARYQEEYRSRSTTDDYRTWLQGVLDLLENRTTQPDYKPRERLNPTMRDEFE